MLSLKNCAFCGKGVPQGEGIMIIKNDGTVSWFCSAKCKKSVLLFKRDPRKLKWARSKK